MELADLARWTPIRFDFSGRVPVVDWADLTAERFVDPFFDQTVARWVSGPDASPLVRTGLEALVALDSEPSLEPAGMIFHLSRCGSTLVSRLLGTLPGVIVLAEPAPLNALLGLDPDRVDPGALVWVVRLVVRALADAGTAMSGGWCSSARAGTFAAGRSSLPPFPRHPGSGSSVTRCVCWPRWSPSRRAGSGFRARPLGPRGFRP
jgi:hypothetical protein